MSRKWSVRRSEALFTTNTWYDAGLVWDRVFERLRIIREMPMKKAHERHKSWSFFVSIRFPDPNPQSVQELHPDTLYLWTPWLSRTIHCIRSYQERRPYHGHTRLSVARWTGSFLRWLVMVTTEWIQRNRIRHNIPGSSWEIKYLLLVFHRTSDILRNEATLGLQFDNGLRYIEPVQNMRFCTRFWNTVL